MKRIIRLGARQGMLDLQNEQDQVRASIEWNGHPARGLSARCLEVEPGVYALLSGDRVFQARVTKSPAAWVVEIAGRQFHVECLDPREASANRRGFGSEGRQNITAPMPGKVVRVLVEEGATVEQGQGLVVVEAMKMQNEMKAPKSGKVIALAARAGSSVAAGQVLVTLE